MKNSITVLDNNNKEVTIELLLNFKIESIDKEYIAYTINDDDNKESALVLISEIKKENNIPKIIDIKEDEAEMVLAFYDAIRTHE